MNNFSVDTQGLGEALQRSASVFYNSSTDLSSAIALITGANEIVQDPARVGNAWKTLSARIRASKSELDALGESTEGMFESTAKLREYLIQMVNVDILKEDGKSFKNLKDIVIELGEAFENNHNEFVKQEVAEKLAGKTQMNVLLSAISNYKQIEKAYKTATEAEGSAAREQEHYAESIQYSLDRFKAALQELAATFLDSDMVKQIVEFGIDVVEKLTEFVRGNDGFAKGLVAIFAGLTGLKDLLSGGKGLQNILSFFVKINEFDKVNPGAGFADALINSFGGISDFAKNASVDVMQLSGVMTETELTALRTGSTLSTLGKTISATGQGFAVAAKSVGAFLISNPVGWAIDAAAIIGLAAAAIYTYKKKQDELLDAAKQKYKETTSEVESLQTELGKTQQRIAELHEQGTLTFVEQAELEKLQRTNSLLELQLKNKEKILELDKKELARANEKDYNRNVTKVNQNYINDYNPDDSVLFTYSDYKNYNAFEKHSDINSAISMRIAAVEKLKTADEDEIESFNKLIDYSDQYIRQYIEQQHEYIQNAKDAGEDATKYEENLRNVYEAVGDIYSSEWNTIEFDRILSTEGIEKNRQELIELAGAGELNIEKFPELAKAIQAADFIGEADNVKAFVEQLKALWLATDEGKNYISAASKFGSGGRLQLKRESQSNFDDWFADVSPDDYDLVNSKEFEQIIKDTQKSLGDAALSAEDYANALQDVKNKQTQIPELKFDQKGFAENIQDIKNLQSVYQKFVDQVEDNPAKVAIDISDVETLREKFENVVGTENFNEFERIVTSANSTADEVEVAFNQMLKSYIDSEIQMQGASAATVDMMVTQLEQAGLLSDGLREYITQQAAAASGNEILGNTIAGTSTLTYEQIDSIQNLGEEFGLTTAQVIEYIIQMRQANGLSISGDLSWLDELAEKLNLDISLLTKLKGMASGAHYYGTSSMYTGSQKDASDKFIGFDPQTGAEMWSHYEDAVASAGDAADTAAPKFKRLSTTTDGNTKSSKGAGTAAKDAAKETNKLSESIDAAAQAYKDLKEITDSYNKNGKISFDQAKKLADMDLRYLATLKLEGKQLKLNAESMNDLAKAQQNEIKISLYRKAIELWKSLKTEADATQFLATSNAEAALSSLALVEAEWEKVSATEAAAGTAMADAQATIKLALANALALSDSIDLSTFSSLGSEIGSSVGESASEEFEKEIDWVERRIEVLDKRLELLKAKYENTTSRGEKFRNLTKQIHTNLKELKTYESAVGLYKEKYNSYLEMLPEDIQDRIKHGAVDILTLTGEEGEEMSDLIDKTQEWWEKLKDAKIKIQEIQTEIANLALEKLTAIKDQLDFDISGETHLKNMIDKLKQLSELRSETPDLKEYYAMSRKYLEADLAYQEEALQKHNKKLNRMLKNGRITIGTDQYKEAVQQQREYEEAILDTKIAIQELNNEANSFENTSMSAHIEDLNYQLEILELQLELLSDTEAEGAQGTEIYAQSALQCKEAVRELTEWLAELKRQYESGAITLAQYTAQTKQAKKEILTWQAKENSYYKKIANNRKKELQDQTKAISEETKEYEKNAKKRIQALKDEADAYAELIAQKKKEIESERDLKKYRDELNEASQGVIDIERRLAAMSGDNSAATVAKRKKLEEELAQKRKDLDDKEYEHRVENQLEALDNDLDAYKKRNQAQQDAISDELDRFKDAQDAKTKMIQDQIDDEQALLAEARAQVESDWDAMYADLKAKCEEHGISIEEIIATWDDSLTPLENYLNMLDLIQEKIDEMNDSSVNLQYGEQEQELKEAMEQADTKRGKIKSKLNAAKAAGDEEKIAKYQKKLDKWTDRYNAYKRQYDALIKGEGILARDEIELTGKTFEENNQKIGTSAANTIMNMLKQNATYEDDTHKMLDATNADWSKANKNKYANLISMLDNSVDSCDDAMNIVKGDSEQISTAIFEIAQQHGLDITDIITGSWNESISTLDNYRALLVDVLRMAAEAGQIDFNTGQKINTSTGGSSTSTSTITSTSTSSTPVSSAGRTKAEIKADIQDVKDKIERAKTNIKNNPGSETNIIREQKIAAWEQELEELKEEKKSIPKYASGLRSATKAHLGLTNEAGREVIVTKNGILTPLQKGDAVLSAAQTKNLFDLAKIDASAILKGLAQQAVNVPQSNVNNVSSLNIDNLVTITGSVTPDMLPLIREEVEKGIKQSWNTINKGIRY